MKRPAFLLLTLLLGACTNSRDIDGTWLNQAVIDAAVESGRLSESVLAYGPNLEWQLDSKTGRARYSNGFEIGEGALSLRDGQSWQVDLNGASHETLRRQGAQLLQEPSPSWPEQRFVRPNKTPAEAPGAQFEHALYRAFLPGTWQIVDGEGQGGLVRFQPDGQLQGLPGAERYALCLSGDCADMAGEFDSLWLQQGNQGAAWLFSRHDDQLEIFAAHNRAEPGDKPSLTPGPRQWLLERQ